LPKAKLDAERLIPGVVPVPERATVWGLPLTLSAILRVAEAAALAEGVKVTAMVQVAAAATLDPQVLLSAKLLGFAPETETLEMLKAALPELVRVTVCAVLVLATGKFPKARLAGERVTAGTALVPVPERATVWGLPLTLSAILRVAEAAPLAEGVKVTLTAQLAPAATELPQLLVSTKLPAFAPETVMPEMFKAALPELERAIV